MDKKIFFIDLDGTLLNDERLITDGNCDAINEAIDMGHIVAVNTGRSITSSMRIINRHGLKREGLYLLAFQGNMIYSPTKDQVLFSDGFSRDDGIRLFNLLKSEGVYAQTYDSKNILSPCDGPELKEYVNITGETFEIISDWKDLPLDVVPKIISISYDHPEILHAFRAKYEDELKKDFEIFFSSEYYLEFTKRGTNKGVGVRELAKLLVVPMENTVGIGDEENDIAMLRAAGTGVAVANAVPMAKEAADIVTRADNNHDAVAEAIKRFI